MQRAWHGRRDLEITICVALGLLVAAGVVGVLVGAAIGAVAVLLVRTERLVKSAVPRLAALPRPACGVALKFDPGAPRDPLAKV
jgi:hypothetical protein